MLVASFWSFGAAFGAAPPEDTASAADTAAPVDTAILAEDADDDGWTVGQGDCDDEKAAINPGKPEVCFDPVDNDCSGFADEQCDDSARLGSLEGGGACTGGGNIAGTGAVLLVPLLLAGRRARRGACSCGEGERCP
jgi:hypothetical protein